MIIRINEKEGKKVVRLIGRLDTNTAPQLENAMQPLVTEKIDLEMDFSQLEYITSAGLRILLSVHKKQKQSGKSFTILHPNKEVMEVFEITGFKEKLNIVSEN